MCRQWSLDASLPSGITPFASIDADGYTTVSNALHFFDAFRNDDYSELAVWSGIRDHIISASCPPMSQTVSFRLLCLTRSTLKTGGWIVVTVVYTSKRSWSFRRHQDSPSRSSTVGHDRCVSVKLRSCVCAQTVLVFTAKGDCVQ